MDRSAAYAMRWVAKNVVAAGLARRCEVQVAYAIGKAQPVGLYVETFGTETVAGGQDPGAITEVFDLRPAAIIDDLDLLRPIYRRPPRTATSAAPPHRRGTASPGSAPTGSTRSRPPSAAEPPPGAVDPRADLRQRAARGPSLGAGAAASVP